MSQTSKKHSSATHTSFSTIPSSMHGPHLNSTRWGTTERVSGCKVSINKSDLMSVLNARWLCDNVSIQVTFTCLSSTCNKLHTVNSTHWGTVERLFYSMLRYFWVSHVQHLLNSKKNNVDITDALVRVFITGYRCSLGNSGCCCSAKVNSIVAGGTQKGRWSRW